MTKPMPEDAHRQPPAKTDVHTIEECDEVLVRRPADQAVIDAWLDERASAMRADVGFRLHDIERMRDEVLNSYAPLDVIGDD